MMPREYISIWTAVHNHPGAAAATPAKDILAEAGLAGITGGRLREIVHDLRVVYGLPVGSNPRGYFEMVTPREFADQRLRLRRRGRAVLAAAGAVKTAYLRFALARRDVERTTGEQRALWKEDGPRVVQRERRFNPPRVGGDAGAMPAWANKMKTEERFRRLRFFTPEISKTVGWEDA